MIIDTTPSNLSEAGKKSVEATEAIAEMIQDWFPPSFTMKVHHSAGGFAQKNQ